MMFSPALLKYLVFRDKAKCGLAPDFPNWVCGLGGKRSRAPLATDRNAMVQHATISSRGEDGKAHAYNVTSARISLAIRHSAAYFMFMLDPPSSPNQPPKYALHSTDHFVIQGVWLYSVIVPLEHGADVRVT